MDIKLKEHFSESAKSGDTQWYDVKMNVESDNLDKIEQVEYYLDPSISNPIIVSENSNNNFEVQVKSWKEFPISAKVTFKDHHLNPVFITSVL